MKMFIERIIGIILISLIAIGIVQVSYASEIMPRSQQYIIYEYMESSSVKYPKKTRTNMGAGGTVNATVSGGNVYVTLHNGDTGAQIGSRKTLINGERTVVQWDSSLLEGVTRIYYKFTKVNSSNTIFINGYFLY